MWRRRRQHGVTLPELLVVVAVIGMAVLVAVPTISETIRSTRLRSATRSLEATFRAARIIAVTQRTDTSIEVRPGPTPPTPPGPTENQYSFTDLRGLTRTQGMPVGIRIVSSTSPIVFRPNGTLDGEAITVLEVQTRSGLKTWEVRTSRMGVTRVVD
jgi:prepilin-type N-terminal cleavage/methylation domain-containing protein